MKDLNSKDNSKVEAELDRAEKNGDIKWVRPLLYAFRDRPEDALRERMRTILSTIKLSGAEGIYIEELESGDCSEIGPRAYSKSFMRRFIYGFIQRIVKTLKTLDNIFLKPQKNRPNTSEKQS